jgi:hypothetical protein
MLHPEAKNKTEKYLNASSEMLDQLGVYQHHDAVSGTAKQAVADDYALRLGKAIH